MKEIRDLTPEQIYKYEQLVFDEAWDDITNSIEFIDAINKRIHELLKELIETEKIVL